MFQGENFQKQTYLNKLKLYLSLEAGSVGLQEVFKEAKKQARKQFSKWKAVHFCTHLEGAAPGAIKQGGHANKV